MNKPPRTRSVHLVCLLLLLVTSAAYWQMLNNGFTDYDDNVYITDNEVVRSGLTLHGIAWALTTTHGANWHPLTWISHMADVSVFGLRPAGHHLTSLILHILNALLLFLVLLRLTSSPSGNPGSGIRNPESAIRNPVAPSPPHPLSHSSLWRCVFVAALFAVHPLHVESVAWAAERKDVLSTFFFLLTALAYVRYVRNPGVSTYLPVFALFALGLMAKPMLVTLPFVLLLLDYWPLNRLTVRWEPRAPDTRRTNTGGSRSTSTSKSNSKSPLVEKVPLFGLALASGIMTIIAQQEGGAIGRLERLPMGTRLGNAAVSYVSYIWKMLCPCDLAVFYPHPGNTLAVWQVCAAAILVLLITVAAIRHASSRRYLVVGWLWYLVTLLPVIGIVQVGWQAMADRYTYLPLIGLFITVAWGFPDLTTRGRGESPTSNIQHRPSNVRLRTPDTQHPTPNTQPLTPALAPSAALPLAIVTLAILSALTWRQVGYWHDSVRLFSHAIGVTRDNCVAQSNLGIALEGKGQYDEAARHYREALRINPNLGVAHYNLAALLARRGRIQEAVAEYEDAVRINPKDAQAQNNLGSLYIKRGATDEAISHLRMAVRARPDYAIGRLNLGLALSEQGDLESASEHLSAAVGLQPGSADAHYRLGVVKAQQGRLDEAVREYQEAIRLRPNHAESHADLAQTFRAQSRAADAIREYREALRLKPDFAHAHNNLSVALYYAGRYTEAWQEIHLAEKYGYQPHPDFLRALASKRADPVHTPHR